jgi:hypothetical protein
MALVEPRLSKVAKTSPSKGMESKSSNLASKVEFEEVKRLEK